MEILRKSGQRRRCIVAKAPGRGNQWAAVEIPAADTHISGNPTLWRGGL